MLFRRSEGGRVLRRTGSLGRRLAAADIADYNVVTDYFDYTEPMTDSTRLGDFEQLVLLAILRLGPEAHGIRLRELLQDEAERRVSRGALYKTLERMEAKGLVTWVLSDSTPERGGIPRRRFQVSPAGVEALRTSRRILLGMWEGLEGALG